MTSRNDARALLKAADDLGFEYLGIDGQGHHAIKHENGGYTIPATPSEYRGVKNAISDMERISGKKLDRPHHRRSRKKSDTSGFTVAQALVESDSWHETWDERIAFLITKRDYLVAMARLNAQAQEYREIPRLIEQIGEIESKLINTYHQRIEPFDPFSLAEVAE